MLQHRVAMAMKAERPWSRFRELTPGRSAYSAPSDRPPQPFQDLPDHVANEQQRRRPDQRRDEIGNLERPVGHLKDAGRERHRGAQGSEKPSDENARHTPAPHEILAAAQESRVTRQRPYLGDVLLVAVAEPVGDPITNY